MEKVLSLTPIPTIILDPQHNILQVSRGFTKATKLDSNRYINHPLDDILHLHPLLNTVSLKLEICNALISKEPQYTEPYLLDHTYWRTRTTPIYSESDIPTSPSLLFIHIEFEDTTEETLRYNHIRDRLTACEPYRLLVNTVKDYAIFLLDSTGCIATWNAGAALLKKYSPSEIIGQHFRIFYSPEDVAAKVPEMELELAIEVGKFEDSGWRYRKDGSKFWANVVITPTYNDDGVLIGFTKITRDMTERHLADAKMIADYEEASKLKSQFLANMSHEIRSPMHGMLSAVSLLTETGLNAEQRDLAIIIEESGSILLQVINDILDYSKLSSGAFQMNSSDLSFKDTVNAVIRSTVTGLRPGLELSTSIDPEIPDIIKGDPLRLRQVLQNIIGNAVKFTETGFIKLISTRTHDPEPDADPDVIQILTEITDTGVGIHPASAALLFTPFTQLDNSVTKRFKGTGLGLSICKSLVELMGGTIGFRTNVNPKGSTFFFTVRMNRASVSPIPSSPIVAPCALDSNITSKHVLLVDDNPVNQKVMVKTLQKMGFTNIDVAGDGRQGVDSYNQGNHDLVIMDISMPVLDGVGATQEIRDAGSKVPIIAMTANALKGDADAFVSAGMSDYIAKPVDRKLLITLLAKWLS